MLSFEFLLGLSAILKLDFLKSPGKSGSARPPRDMKLGNWCATCVQYPSSCAPKLARKWKIKHCPVVQTDGRCTVTWLPNFLGWADLLTHGAPQARFARQSSAIKKTNFLKDRFKLPSFSLKIYSVNAGNRRHASVISVRKGAKTYKIAN